jgi:hypothetical protein
MKTVKSTSILTFLFLLPLFLHAQEFAPVGATWHVSTYASNGIFGYKTINCTGDTTILGKHCRIIEIPQTLNETPSPAYMYEEAGKLYYLHTPDPNEPDSFKFNLLLDFNAGVGESWDMELWSDWLFPAGWIPDSIELVVDSISYFYYNNGQDSLRIQHLSTPSSQWDKFQVIEKIGFSAGLFPDFSGTSLGCCSSIYETRCYEDSNCGLIKFIEQECDYTATEEARPSMKLTISPNQANDKVSVFFPDAAGNSSLHLYNAGGQLLHTLPVAKGAAVQEIDLSQYPDGLYFIQWRRQEAVLSSGKIIKRR